MSDFDLATVDIIDAWHFYAETTERPFASIRDIFTERLRLQDIGDPREHVLKLVMNSLYGKFIQITPQLLPEPSLKVGPLFLPAYASEITARTRMQLVRTILERDIDPIACFTDCIMTASPENLASEGLGHWNLETSGRLLVLGCGVYEFESDSGTDTHTRGFRLPKDTGLIDILNSNTRKTHFEFTESRPVSIAEYFHYRLAESGHHVNEWVERTKSLSINFDKKRVWPSNFHDAGHALSSSMRGIPLQVNM